MESYGMKYAEHNISCDPEAAKQVFDKSSRINVTILDWPLTMLKSIPYDTFTQDVLKTNSAKQTHLQKFLHFINQGILNEYKDVNYIACSGCAASVIINQNQQTIRGLVEIDIEDGDYYGQSKFKQC